VVKSDYWTLVVGCAVINGWLPDDLLIYNIYFVKILHFFQLIAIKFIGILTWHGIIIKFGRKLLVNDKTK